MPISLDLLEMHGERLIVGVSKPKWDYISTLFNSNETSFHGHTKRNQKKTKSLLDY